MARDVEGLIGELTVAEKAALISGADFWHTVAVPRLGIESILLSDGPNGLRTQTSGLGEAIGIGGSVPATCFPPEGALASSWDPALLERIGAALAVEARHQGVSVVLGPGVNIKRSPLGGRNFEYLSEDPYLTGRLGAALVRGLQSQGVGASLKHFAANNQETDRLRISVEVDERTLREIYLPAFEHIVRTEQPWTIMAAYNKINGTYCTEHHELLTGILRDEWGFTGLVVSDWGATHDRVAAARAGLDLEMPPNLAESPAAVEAAVTSGELPLAVLDERVRAVLTLIDRAQPALAEPTLDAAHEEHHRLAREAAARSIVLLRNETRARPDGTHAPVLPIPLGTRVAAIGEFARTPRFQGSGSSQVNAVQVDVPLTSLEAVFGADRVSFAPGYRIAADLNPLHLGDHDEQAMRDEAVATARDADVVLFFLGLPDAAESEGIDRETIDLPADQLAVLDAVTAVSDRVVAVLLNGSVVSLAGWHDRVAAILECWLGGQAMGGGLVDVLSGAINPSGRLAETIPLRLADSSSFYTFPGEDGHVRYGERVFVGYRGYDHVELPVAYPFGYGLSYTTFALSGLELDRSGRVRDDDLTVTARATVANTGAVSGATVVQAYVGPHEATVARPPRELGGFARVELGPGASAEVEIVLEQRAFSFWSSRLHRFVVEEGDFTVWLGHSSRDLPLSGVVHLPAPSIAPPLTADSTLAEWLGDATGKRRILDLLPDSDGQAVLEPGLLKLVGSMPISTLAAFPGLAFLGRLLDR